VPDKLDLRGNPDIAPTFGRTGSGETRSL